MAKASLSSLVGHVPNYAGRIKEHFTHSNVLYIVSKTIENHQSDGAVISFVFGPHHEPDGPLLIDVDGDVGALDPGVGAQVSQPYVRVPADKRHAGQPGCT